MGWRMLLAVAACLVLAFGRGWAGDGPERLDLLPARLLAVSPEGNIAASATSDTMMLFRLDRIETLFALRPETGRPMSLAISEAGGVMAWGDDLGVVRLVGIDDGQERAQVRVGEVPVTALRYNEIGSLLAAGTITGDVRVIVARNLAIRGTFPRRGEPASVWDIHFAEDRASLVTAFGDGEVRRQSLATFAESPWVRVATGLVPAVGVVPDEAVTYHPDPDGSIIRREGNQSVRVLARLPLDEGAITGIDVLAGGRWLLVGFASGEGRLVDAEAGTIRPLGARVREVRFALGGRGWVGIGAEGTWLGRLDPGMGGGESGPGLSP